MRRKFEVKSVESFRAHRGEAVPRRPCRGILAPLMPQTERRVAAIDIGTNSIHMIVAERQRQGYRVVDKEREMVQLGMSSLDGAPLTEGAMERGVAALTHMAEVARGWSVDDVIAVATSAVREAPNRREFLRRVKDAAGIRVKVISGEDEADYIYYAVCATVELEGRTALCVDVGGGSVEFILGTGEEIYFTASEPLGSLRLAQRFGLEDRPRPGAAAACRAFVASHMRRVRKRALRVGYDLCVGTSGTIQALAAMTASGGDSAAGVRTLRREALAEITRELERTSAAQRVTRFGLEPRRAATIVAGAIALDEIVSALEVSSMLVSPAAMREGMIESYFAHLEPKDKRSGSSLRRRSVIALAERTGCDRRHGKHVAQLALRLFDQTRMLHALPMEARELLEHAAMLHEAGMHVSDSGYHKHTYYLVRHAGLRGFTEEQLAVLANVARYHRKAPPRDDHPNLADLTPAQVGDVEKLSAILRIAEALDRSHRQAVRDVAVQDDGHGGMRLIVRTRADARVEIAAAARRAKYFGSLFDRKVRIESR
jgi:exopolyphosphatase/guanosine-5'-triphosphate,3'-diphosphate pyrophosphatase